MLDEGLSEALGDKLADGEPLAEAEGEREADGEREAEGLREGLGAETNPGTVPYQSTPGRGPGWPSSYRNKLLASFMASRGRREASISVITPLLKFERVTNDGLGSVVWRFSSLLMGISDPELAAATVWQFERISPTTRVID